MPWDACVIATVLLLLTVCVTISLSWRCSSLVTYWRPLCSVLKKKKNTFPPCIPTPRTPTVLIFSQAPANLGPYPSPAHKPPTESTGCGLRLGDLEKNTGPQTQRGRGGVTRFATYWLAGSWWRFWKHIRDFRGHVHRHHGRISKEVVENLRTSST